MTARSIWSELRGDEGGWGLLEKWRANKQPETLHLDFKRGGWDGGDVRGDDRKALAKALSAFSNTEGGVLVFGAATGKGKPDTLESFEPIDRIEQYAERLRVYTQSLATPLIPGVQVTAIHSPAESDRGVAVVFIPASDGGPHRTSGRCEGSVCDRYYIRSTTDTTVMPHSILEAMFGRRPPPVLRLALRHDGRNFSITIVNMGRGFARSPSVSLWMSRQDATGEWRPIQLVNRDGDGPWSELYRSVEPGNAPSYTFRPKAHHLLYPKDTEVVARVRPRTSDPEGARYRASCRLDAEGMAPAISLDREIDPDTEKVTLLWDHESPES